MDANKEVIVKNLVRLRNQAGLTQLQLAEMLNYSDKAVSKWERGEALPDICVFAELAEIYGVTIDSIVRDAEVTASATPKARKIGKRVFITVLSVGLVWFVATCLFMIFYFISPTRHRAYLWFLFAPFATGVVLVVFSAKWGNQLTTGLSCSLLLWGLVVFLHLAVTAFVPFRPIFVLYIAGGVFQLMIILWFVYRKFVAKKK